MSRFIIMVLGENPIGSCFRKIFRLNSQVKIGTWSRQFRFAVAGSCSTVEIDEEADRLAISVGREFITV